MKYQMPEFFECCISHPSKNPIVILEDLMRIPSCRMHGPEHHTLVGAALLTAYHNAGGNIDLPAALEELHQRAAAVPGAACGFWGACGASISTGQYLSVVTGSSPLAQEPWGLCIGMTSKSLDCLAKVGGPRCCKRNSYLSILAAIDYTQEHLGITMERTQPVCCRSSKNQQCIEKRCPFWSGKV